MFLWECVLKYLKYFSETYPAKHSLHVRDIDFNLSWHEVFSTSFQMRVCEYYNTIWLARKQQKNPSGLRSFQNNFVNISETAFNIDYPLKDMVYCPQFVLESSFFQFNVHAFVCKYCPKDFDLRKTHER